MKGPPDPAALLEENARIRRLRRFVDLSLALIAQAPALERREAQGYQRAARGFACALFPEKGETFDLIYAPRFRRLIAERFGPDPHSR